MELLKFIQTEYIPGARTNLAAESLPDGKAYYQSKILENTTTHLSPAQIHQIGLDELAKIHAEMVATMKQTGFQGDFLLSCIFCVYDPRFYARTPQELLMQAAFIAKEFDRQDASHSISAIFRGCVSPYFQFPLPRRRSTPLLAAARGHTW